MQYYTILVFIVFDELEQIVSILDKIPNQIELTNLWYTISRYPINEKTIEKMLVYNYKYNYKLKLCLNTYNNTTKNMILIKAVILAYNKQIGIINNLDIKSFLKLIRKENYNRCLGDQLRQYYLTLITDLIKSLDHISKIMK